MKIQMKSITLNRAEGPINYCDKPVTCISWKAADEWLQWQSFSAPPTGYDKVDFTVLYEDGNKYDGTYLLTHGDKLRAKLLEKHMKNHLEAIASGKWDKYHPGISRQAKEFLDKYQIGE